MHRLVVALVTLIGLTGAAFLAAYLLLFSASSDRAAGLAPAATAFYANVYLQPSAAQQMNLGALVGRLPGFADEASLDDKVDQLVQNLMAGTGLDYRQDIEPWLGSQVALALWPGGEAPSEPIAVVLVEAKDPDEARSAIARIVARGGGTFTPEAYEGVELQVSDASVYAFVGETLVVGQEPDAVRAVVDVERGAPSLADDAEFRASMDRVPPDHLASVFVDLAAIGEATGVSDQLGGLTTATAALLAEPDGLRLTGRAPLDSAAGASAPAGSTLGGDPATLVEWMPADTIAEVIIFDLRRTLEAAEAAASSMPGGADLGGAVDSARALAAFGLGIDLDADLLPLLDGEVGVAFTGSVGGRPAGQLLLRPEDADEAAAALDRLVTGLRSAGAEVRDEEVGGTDVTVVSLSQLGEAALATVDGVTILGAAVEDVGAALEANASGSSLALSDDYRRTFQLAGTRAGNEAFVDINGVLEAAGGTAELPDDARDILAEVGTFGFTAPTHPDEIEFHAVLTLRQGQDE